MTAVRTAFDTARAEGRSALIGYLPAGFPDVDGAIDAVKAMIDNGVDIVEVGLPYSDPVMDGPVIQQATEHALAAGFRVKDGLRTIDPNIRFLSKPFDKEQFLAALHSE